MICPYIFVYDYNFEYFYNLYFDSVILLPWVAFRTLLESSEPPLVLIIRFII